MSTNLTHIALHVPEIEPVIQFYQSFCQLELVHERSHASSKVAWLAEPGRGDQFVIVVIGGGPKHDRPDADFGHLGFALESKAAVDDIAARAKAAGCLVWTPRQEPPPIGYYCGVIDPAGNVAEFSFGQPLGPEESTET
jgi:predicted enzyme related to lactoylglutathione lyase